MRACALAWARACALACARACALACARAWALACALLLLWAAPGALAQTAPSDGPPEASPDATPEPPALLIADRVEIAEDGRLIASGAVEVIQGDTRMTARRITYDDRTGGLSVEGPIVVTQGDRAVILASSAEIDRELRDGILRSARLVLDRQLQFAAAEINRVEGRYNQLSKVTASSCEVCAAHPVPLWQIRARRVVHDTEERQIYFDDARFEVAGLPIFYLPRLRLPDPTLERATGFLVPSIRITDELGEGVKIPYFIAFGDSRDLTLTPYIATNVTRTLEARYRQALRFGSFEINTAVSSDDIVEDSLRGYLFADGSFALPRDFRLAFDVELTSDESYLLDYDFSDKDRLDSALSLTRARPDEFIGAEVIGFESLRSDEDNETQPFLVADAFWLRRFRPDWIGGTASFALQAHGHERRSSEDMIGRDVGRFTGRLDWRGDALGPAGLLLAAEARLFAEYSFISEDSDFPDPVGRVIPTAAVELRWPWSRAAGPGGATHLIEPVAQIVWTPDDAADPGTPSDESTQLELDEGNLFALDRFPATDRTEAGLRANLGLSYTRYAPSGWSLGLTAGRIYRAEDLGQFDGFTALDGPRSDWLAALSVDFDNRFRMINRALFDEDFAYNKFETRLEWTGPTTYLAGTYTWLAASPAEDRPDTTNEWRLAGAWQVTDRWNAAADWRYDLRLDRSASAQIGLQFRTECVTLNASVRRRFTSSDQIRPTTDVNFDIELAGFGGTNADRNRPKRQNCLP